MSDTSSFQDVNPNWITVQLTCKKCVNTPDKCIHIPEEGLPPWRLNSSQRSQSKKNVIKFITVSHQWMDQSEHPTDSCP